jgi:putative two-component system response regulator
MEKKRVLVFEDNDDSAGADGETLKKVKRSGNAERILVVDDVASIRIAFSRKLTGEGYNCMMAENGEGALELLKKYPFALVLLDITMPGISGMDVLREIVARYPDTAVIMITAIDNAETAIELLKIGAYDYIIKPVYFDELPLRVQRALDRRELMLENKEYRLDLEEKVRNQTDKIRDSLLNSIKSLALALEAKDKYTSGHSQRVADIAVEIAQKLDMPPKEVEQLRFASLVHDIGKIGIKESVINKKEGLTDDEYAYISTHSVIGENILTPVIEDEEILKMVRHHHERYDGRGYPDGLSAEQIPLGARILTVADMFDAMTSDRPYRKSVSPEMAINELRKHTATQFDPQVVDAFIGIMSEKDAPSFLSTRTAFR